MAKHEAVRLTGPDLQDMRQKRGMSVKDFWDRVGYSLNRGYAYEAERSQIPEHVRRLIYIEYVLGIPTNPDSDDGRQFAEILQQNNPVQLLEMRKRLAMGVGIINATLSELSK